jgi:hypothetical protein
MRKSIMGYLVNRVTIVMVVGILCMGKACFGMSPYTNMFWMLLGIFVIMFGGAYVCEECKHTYEEERILNVLKKIVDI